MWHIPTWYFIIRTLWQLRCLNCYSSAILLKENDRAAVSFFTHGSEWSNPDTSNVSLPVDPGGPRGPCVPTPGLPFSPFSPGKPKEIVFSHILIKTVSGVYYLTRIIVPYVISHLKTDGRERRRWMLKIIWFFFHPFLTASEGQCHSWGLKHSYCHGSFIRMVCRDISQFPGCTSCGNLPLDYTKVQLL